MKNDKCHFYVKKGQKVLKIGTRGNSGLGNSDMVSIFQIDEVVINYSSNDDMVSLLCQTSSENSKNWHPG